MFARAPWLYTRPCGAFWVCDKESESWKNKKKSLVAHKIIITNYFQNDIIQKIEFLKTNHNAFRVQALLGNVDDVITLVNTSAFLWPMVARGFWG